MKNNSKVLVISLNYCAQVVAKCRELGHKDGKYHYIAADMMDLNFTETLIKVRLD